MVSVLVDSLMRVSGVAAQAVTKAKGTCECVTGQLAIDSRTMDIFFGNIWAGRQAPAASTPHKELGVYIQPTGNKSNDT